MGGCAGKNAKVTPVVGIPFERESDPGGTERQSRRQEALAQATRGQRSYASFDSVAVMREAQFQQDFAAYHQGGRAQADVSFDSVAQVREAQFEKILAADEPRRNQDLAAYHQGGRAQADVSFHSVA